MARRTAGAAWWLPVLMTAVIVAGCDLEDAGYYTSSAYDGVEADPDDVVEDPFEDVAPGFEADLMTAFEDMDLGDVADAAEPLDPVTNQAPDTMGGTSQEAADELPGAPDVQVEPITCAPTQQDAQGPHYIEGAPLSDSLAGPEEPGDQLLIKGFVLQD